MWFSDVVSKYIYLMCLNHTIKSLFRVKLCNVLSMWLPVLGLDSGPQDKLLLSLTSQCSSCLWPCFWRSLMNRSITRSRWGLHSWAASSTLSPAYTLKVNHIHTQASFYKTAIWEGRGPLIAQWVNSIPIRVSRAACISECICADLCSPLVLPGIISQQAEGYQIQVCSTLCQGCSYTRGTRCNLDS